MESWLLKRSSFEGILISDWRVPLKNLSFSDAVAGRVRRPKASPIRLLKFILDNRLSKAVLRAVQISRLLQCACEVRGNDG